MSGDQAAEPGETGDPMLVMLHPAIVPAFRAWLATNGLDLGRLPDNVGFGGEPTYIVTPVDL